jgi:hypothetical protein
MRRKFSFVFSLIAVNAQAVDDVEAQGASDEVRDTLCEPPFICIRATLRLIR